MNQFINIQFNATKIYMQINNKNIFLMKLNEIGKALLNNCMNNNDIGVLSGLSGISIFLFYQARYFGGKQKSDEGLVILGKALEYINKGSFSQTYSRGLIGYGWAINHLSQEEFVEVDDSLLISTDDLVFRVMKNYLINKNYDFLHGAIGCGFYFLKRFQNTPSNGLKLRYKRYLIQLIKSLNKLSEIDKRGTKWLSVIDIETGERGYNLSLSHGMSSIVNFLSRLYLIEDFKNSVEDMLKGGVSYIISNKSKATGSIALFPNYIKPNEKAQWNSRLAWCYGDLGIGLSLWKASKVLKDEALEKKTIDILIHSTKRRLKENTMVEDAGVCHGSFGNAQIFNYMYRQTKIKEFKNATDFWMNDGLAKANFNDGYAGFKIKTQNGWKNETSILTGIAGIGLSILSYLSEEDTNWDECLMIS